MKSPPNLHPIRRLNPKPACARNPIGVAVGIGIGIDPDADTDCWTNADLLNYLT